MIPLYFQSYLSMTRARSTLEQVIKLRLKAFDLSLTQFHMLDLLVNQKAATPVQFAEPLGMTSAGVTTVADQLEHKQMIERQRNQPDRRTVRLNLTPEGAQVHAAASAVLCPQEEESHRLPASYFLALNSLLKAF